MFQSSRRGIFVDCFLYRASRLFGKFRGKNDGDFVLLMVSRGVIMFLVVIIMLYLRIYLLVHLLSLVLLVNKVVLSNMVVVRRCWGC